MNLTNQIVNYNREAALSIVPPCAAFAHLEWTGIRPGGESPELDLIDAR